MAESKKIQINGKEYLPEEVPDQMTYTLRKPVVVGGITVDCLELQEPTAGEYETFCRVCNDGNSTLAMIKLITAVTAKSNKDISEPIIKQMGMRDMWEVSGYMLVFTNPGQ